MLYSCNFKTTGGSIIATTTPVTPIVPAAKGSMEQVRNLLAGPLRSVESARRALSECDGPEEQADLLEHWRACAWHPKVAAILNKVA